MPSSPDPPHVFVARADLTRLACHAWLLPGKAAPDGDPRVSEKWLAERPALAEQFEHGRLRPPHDRTSDRVWRLRRPDPDDPRPYLVDTGAYGAGALDWYLEGLGQFFAAVESELATSPPRPERARPLVGVPMLGTRRRGSHRSRGSIMVAVLRELYAWADRLGTDIALVTLHDSDFSAAQWARQHLAAERDPWSALASAELGAAAESLALRARNARLVLFLGAGVSAGAGLPTWEELLASLARDAGFTEAERADMRARLAPVDQADLISRALADRGGSLGTEIAAAMDAAHYSLSHALAAALPVQEIVTTNYDELFEAACEAIGRGVAQLPYRPDRESDRWLLKLHGTLSQPDDIVLTRDDFLAYYDRRAALSGMVQGLLITKHMLFVGFSLTDETFHRIAHDVRKAIRPAGGERRGPFGTAILLQEDPLRQRLWDGDVQFAGAATTEAGPSAAARRVEIFLDRLLASSTTNNQHLLDPTYDDLLEPDERHLRDALLTFLEHTGRSPAARAPAWRELEELARRLGRPATPPDDDDHQGASP